MIRSKKLRQENPKVTTAYLFRMMVIGKTHVIWTPRGQRKGIGNESAPMPAIRGSRVRLRGSSAACPLALGLIWFLSIGGWLYAQPANDQCSGAIPLTTGVPFTMNTTDATDGGDPLPACGPSFGGGVWFSFTPASNGLISVTTCGSSFETVVQVYSG